MWNCRLGAVPVVEVKIPQPVGKAEHPVPPKNGIVSWSAQNGKMVKSGWPRGKQTEVNWDTAVENSAVPLESKATMFVVLPYNVTGNGRVTGVTQSSQWLPMSVVPRTIVSVPGVMTYWQTAGVGVAVGVGVDVGVGDGVGTCPGASIKTATGEPVLKKPTLASVGFGGWFASNRKLYNVPKRIALAFWFCANVSVFQVIELLA